MKQVPKNIAVYLLRGYKFAVSPLFGNSCRYRPTCSEYAMQAIELHGAIRGGLMGVGRVLRCHPFSASGHDPVPPKNSDAGLRLRGTAVD